MSVHKLAGEVEGNYGTVTAIAAGFPDVVAEFVAQNSWSHPLQALLKTLHYWCVCVCVRERERVSEFMLHSSCICKRQGLHI